MLIMKIELGNDFLEAPVSKYCRIPDILNHRVLK